MSKNNGSNNKNIIYHYTIYTFSSSDTNRYRKYEKINKNIHKISNYH